VLCPERCSVSAREGNPAVEHRSRTSNDELTFYSFIAISAEKNGKKKVALMGARSWCRRDVRRTLPDKCGFQRDESAMGLETLIILLSLMMQRLLRAREFLKTAGEVYEHARGYVILRGVPPSIREGLISRVREERRRMTVVSFLGSVSAIITHEFWIFICA